jgi:uncharacterized protein (DUF1800 family)
MATPDYSDARHLYRRAGFGATDTEIATLHQLPLDARVNFFVDATAPDDPFDNILEPSQWEGEKRVILNWYERMTTTSAPLHEKMTIFWHNHFVSSLDKMFPANWMYDQFRLYRQNALGNVRTLAQAMALTPAMLDYLDNRDNTNAGQQQNFARELMELFTLGVGNYTETDVDEVARAWTGHGIDPVTGAYKFTRDLHDDGEKTIFGITGNFNGPDVINMIFDHPDKRQIAAQFLTKKLWSYFAYPNPADVIIVPLAQVLMDAEWEVKPLLRAIFAHPDFYSAAAKNGLVRTPVEFVVAVLKSLRPTINWFSAGFGLVGLPAFLYAYGNLRCDVAAANMGMGLFHPPDVSGWKANSYWLGTSAVGERAEFARAANEAVRKDLTHPLSGNASLSPNAVIDLVESALGLAFGAESRAVLVAFAAENRATSTAGTDDPHLFTLAALTPEFQLA